MTFRAEQPEKTPPEIPTEHDAGVILKSALGKDAKTIKRFPTGLANYVYDITTDDDKLLVVRLPRPDLKSFFGGALFWYPKLKEKGVPLPELYYSKAFDLYTASFGVEFLSEMGHAFNKEKADPIDQGQINRFVDIVRRYSKTEI